MNLNVRPKRSFFKSRHIDINIKTLKIYRVCFKNVKQNILK